METLGFALGCVVGTTLVSVAGLLVFRKFFKIEQLSQHHHIAEPMLSLVGTLFSVLLGFLVAGAISKYGGAHQNIYLEANAIANVYRLAKGFDGSEAGGKIRALCREYSLVVVEDEWKLMESGSLSPNAWRVIGEIWDTCLELHPKDMRESNIHAVLLQAMEQAGENRRMRSLQVINVNQPEVWIVTICGATIIIGFTYLFSAERTSLQCWMVAMVAISLSLNLFLLISFSRAFSGWLKIKPDAFIMNLDLMSAENGKR